MSLFKDAPQFADTQFPGITMSLMEHVEADLQGPRNPADEPGYLANLIAAMLATMTHDQQRRVASLMHFKEVE